MDIVSLAGLGALCGLVVGMTSTGGGALLTPGLILLGVPPGIAIGTDLLIASVMKLFGGGVYARSGQVHWPTVRWLACGSVPGALVGVYLINLLPAGSQGPLLSRVLGLALLLAGTATLVRVLWRSASSSRPMPRPWVTALLGAVVGALVSATSIGSGSLLLCVLAVLFPLSSRTLVGTDLVHALVLSTAATLAQLVSGRVDFLLAAQVLVGGIPGVLLGTKLTALLPERAMRGALACTLMGLGVYFSVPGEIHGAIPAVEASAREGPP